MGLIQLSCRHQTITVAPDSESKNRMAKVEVDVFSGRPNPSWELTTEESDELGKLIDSLPTADVINLPEGGLGFRGFIIYGLELNRIDSNIRITVIDDVVSVYEVDGHRQDLYDKTKIVFNFLQRMSSAHLDTDLYKAIFE